MKKLVINARQATFQEVCFLLDIKITMQLFRAFQVHNVRLSCILFFCLMQTVFLFSIHQC